MTALPKTKDLHFGKRRERTDHLVQPPEAKNSLSAEMVDEIHAVLDAAAHDKSLRTLIVRGKGDIFCAVVTSKGSSLACRAVNQQKKMLQLAIALSAT